MPIGSNTGPFYDVVTTTISTTGVQTIMFPNTPHVVPKAVMAMSSQNSALATTQNVGGILKAVTTNNNRGSVFMGLTNNVNNNPHSRAATDPRSVVVAGEIYTLGGADTSGNSSRLWKYNISTGATTLLANCPVTISLCGMVAHTNGKIYCIGGTQAGVASAVVRIYDIGTNTWTTGTSIPVAKNSPACDINTTTNQIYIYGGSVGPTIMYRYDIAVGSPVGDTVTTLAAGPSMTNPRGVYDSGANVLFLFSNTTLLSRYNVGANTYTTLTAAPISSSASTLNKVGNFLYVIGGAENTSIGVVQRYDITLGTWSSAFARSPLRFQAHWAVVSGTNIYCIGGNANTGALVEGSAYQTALGMGSVYDTVANAWSFLSWDKNAYAAYQTTNQTVFSGSGSVQWIVIPNQGNPPASGVKTSIRFAGFITGGFKINVVTLGSPITISWINFAGSNLQKVDVLPVNNNTPATTFGYTPDACMYYSAMTPANDFSSNQLYLLEGWAANRPTLQERSFATIQDNLNFFNFSTGQQNFFMHNIDSPSVVALRLTGSITFTGTGINITSNDSNYDQQGFVFALKFDPTVTEDAFYQRNLFTVANKVGNNLTVAGVGYKPGIVFSNYTSNLNAGATVLARSIVSWQTGAFTELANTHMSVNYTQSANLTVITSRTSTALLVDKLSGNWTGSLLTMNAGGFTVATTGLTTAVTHDIDYYTFILPGVPNSVSGSFTPPQPVVAIVT
jgi:Kelch motif